MQKLTSYTNRKQIRGEYKMVSYKTREYELLDKFHNITITKSDAEKVLKWLSKSHKMKLIVNFRNCNRSWGGVRRGQPFVTIAKRIIDGELKTTLGLIIHEFTHAHNYHFGSGKNHDDGFILMLDKFVKKVYKTKCKEMLPIKEKYNI